MLPSSTSPRRHLALVCLTTLLLCAPGVQAQPVPLSDADLGRVWGQALIDITNTSLNGLDFTRMTLNADISMSANFSNIRLGEYSYNTRNASGADLDITRLQIGRSDLGDANRLVSFTNPYFELAYANVGSAGTRDVVGVRFGFEGVSGQLGVQINTVSGSVAISDGAGHVLDSRSDPLGGKRWDGTSCGASACPFTLANIGALQLGDANGPSRDMFIAMVKQAVQFPAATPSTPLPDITQPGFWLNLRDRIAAANLTAQLPPNLPKP